MATWTATLTSTSLGTVNLHNYAGTDLILADGFRKREILYKDLKPASHTLDMTIRWNTTLAEALYDASDEVISITVQKDASNWFVGFLEPVGSFSITGGANTINLQAVTAIELLNKEYPTPFSFADKDICNPSNTSDSFVHTLVDKIGDVSVSATIPAITDQALSYVHNTDDKIIDLIADSTLAFKYVPYTNAAGELSLYDWGSVGASAGTINEDDMVGSLRVKEIR